MKKILISCCIIASGLLAQAQTSNAPIIYSWVRNLTGATGYNSIPSNVLSVTYDASNVYIAADCIPGYSIGPWAGNPNTPSNQGFSYKITRNPVQNTGTATTIGNGHTGVWSNGVSVFNVSDAMSYNNAGVWNRNAYYWEGSSFDNCLGHPAPNGEYHHHVNPKCLYDDTDSTHHSPIIGYAFDGFPIYGAYAYANTNGTGGIKRMKSSYVLSTNTTRTNGPAVSTSYPNGCFMEDYVFTSGAGDLDLRNGRFCVTPEYPNGIYCYFASIDSTLAPTFPYTMYKNYYGVVQTGNTGPSGGHNTAPNGDTLYTAVNVPTISIVATDTTICAGTSVTFTPTITKGGTNPTYIWAKNGVTVGTGSTYTSSTLTNNDTISCTLTSNAYYLTSSTATSNKIIIRVSSSVTPSVSISTPTTSICPGTSITFTPTPTNGGASPTYQWKLNNNNIATGNTFTTSSLANNDVVSCVMTSNATCVSTTTATSTGITVTVGGNLVPSISISTPSTSACTGSAITFTATPVNGGATPSFQWKVNGNNVGNNDSIFTSSSLNNNDLVSCVLTSSSTCASPSTATSTTLKVTISSTLVPSVTINTAANNICSGATASFTATATNGGAAPAYQWTVNNVNAGTSSDTFSSNNLPNQAVVKCILTSSNTCASPTSATSTGITVTVNANPTATISPSGSIFVCAGDSVQLTASGGVSYHWSSSTSNASVFASQAGPYNVTVTDANNCSAVASTPANVSLRSATVPTITQSGNTLTASHAAMYQWLLNGSPTNAADTNQTLNITTSGSYSVAIEDSNGCKATSLNYNFVYTGISEIGNAAVKLYPTPNSGAFVIEIPIITDARLTILDIYGRQLYQTNLTETKQTVANLNLAPAMYFVNVYMADSTHTFKMQVIR